MKTYVTTRNNDCFYPSIFDAFDLFATPSFFETKNELKANVTEVDGGYELQVAAPGFKKEELSVSVENGYLTVSANKTQTEESGEEKRKWLRRELRESSQRSFYVGDYLTAADVKAKYENGVLDLFIPKEQPREEPSGAVTID